MSTPTIDRVYTRNDVGEILKASEVRQPEGKRSRGHTLSAHVYCSNDDLVHKDQRQSRIYDNNRIVSATAFCKEADAVTAALGLLNSERGQSVLKDLVSPTVPLNADIRFVARIGTTIRMRFSSGNLTRTGDATSAEMLLVKLSIHQIHIHTCFPILGDVPLREI